MKIIDCYNYRKNISVVTTPKGDKVITMNSQVFDLLVNHLYDAAKLQEIDGHKATSEDTKELWRALNDKEEESM